MTICSIFSRCLIVTSISQQRQQDGASIEHPHLFHWPPPSAQSSDDLRESEKTWPFAAFFLVALSLPLSLNSGNKMVLPLSIPIFSTGRPRILRFPCEIRVTNALHGRYFPLTIPIKSR